jgi:hypothetical protein
MPIFDYVCPTCKAKYERFTFGNGHLLERHAPLCEVCGIETDQVEFSVPAKRNPEYGIQK